MLILDDPNVAVLDWVAVFLKVERSAATIHLTGGVTSVAYGEPRLTQEIDIVLQNESTRRQLAQLLSALIQSDFIFDSSAVETAVADKKMFQLFDSIESFKLDMYPREMIPGELGRSVIHRFILSNFRREARC